MRYRVLGGLEVVDGSRALDLGGPKQRAVLAALLVDAGRSVTVDRLIDVVWGDHPPPRSEASLQTYVSNLRRLLEPDRAPGAEPTVLVTRSAGYALVVEPDDVDLTRFEDLVEEGRARRRAGDNTAGAIFDEALTLWAPVLPEFAGEPFLREVEARLEALHGLALEEALDLRLDRGDHDGAIADLETAVLRYPVRERLWGLLALAHYRAGRQTDALRALQRARYVLSEDVGVEPGPELRRLEADILDHADHLQPPRRELAGAQPAPLANIPSRAEPFVGRDADLATLVALVDGAAAGQGRVGVVSGEPGIGKTRLVEEMVARAVAGGAVVAWARCPESAASAAFWPLTQLADQLVETGALAPGNRPDLPRTAETADGEGERLALHAGAVQALASLERPCVLVIDDLQWADAASLRLIEYVAGELRSLPVALVVTTRPLDEASAAPLVDCLAELARQPGAVRIDLKGLSRVAVDAWLEVRSSNGVDASTSGFVHDRSGGNPFFVRELVELLVSEGGPSAGVPAAVQDVVRRRVGRLPGRTQQLLTVASVVGRTFDVDIVARVGDVGVTEALEALDPAVAAGLLAEEPEVLGRFRFSHALVAEALVTELAPSRRTRLHAATALALDALRPADEAQLVELAHHAAAGALAGTADLAVDSSARAARDAAARTAHEDAAGHWATALRAVDLARPGDRRARYELLLELGLSRRRADDVSGAQEALLEAMRVADDLDDVEAMTRAATSLTQEGFWQVGDYLTPEPALAAGVSRVLERLGPTDSSARAELLGILANLLYYSGDHRRLDALSAQAVAVARRVGDPAVLARALVRRVGAIWRADTVEERLATAEELVSVAEAHRLPPSAQFAGLFARMFTRLELGEPPGPHLPRLRALADATGSPAIRTQLGWFEANWLAQRGDRAAAERTAFQAYELYRRTRRWGADVILAGAMLLVWVDRGDFPQAIGIEIEPLLQSTYSVIAREALAWALLETSLAGEARAAAGPPGSVPDPPDDWMWLATMAGATLVRAGLGDVEAVALLYPQLLPYSGRFILSGSVPVFGAVDWALGLAAEVLGDRPAALRHLGAAVDLFRRVGARSFLARALLAHGRLLAGSDDSDDRHRGEAVVEEARTLATELGLVPVLRRLAEEI